MGLVREIRANFRRLCPIFTNAEQRKIKTEFAVRIKSTWLLLTVLLLFAFTAADAGDPDKKRKKKTNWSLTLDNRDKNPYGGYLAYTSLKSYFPYAKVSALSRDFRYNSLQGQRLVQHFQLCQGGSGNRRDYPIVVRAGIAGDHQRLDDQLATFAIIETGAADRVVIDRRGSRQQNEGPGREQLTVIRIDCK